MSRSQEFEVALLDGYQRAGREVGYWGTRFLQSVRRKGGVATAKQLLAKPGKVSAGFQALLDAGRLDLAVESVVLRPQFRGLFSAPERAEASRRLEAHSAHPRTRRTVPPDSNFPYELPEGRNYRDGAVQRVLTNRYERDPRARRACLAKHGVSCCVCGFDFEKRYGSLGTGFVHVHHKKPLATLRADYMLDPVRDLCPVCPNCHAMLHAQDPPLSVDELKNLLQ
jgi:5-methylcytosine-specific restriction protein A